MPSLLLYEKNSRLLGKRDIRHMKDVYGFDCQAIEGGHMFPMKYPEKIAAIICQWLDDQEQRNAAESPQHLEQPSVVKRLFNHAANSFRAKLLSARKEYDDPPNFDSGASLDSGNKAVRGLPFPYAIHCPPEAEPLQWIRDNIQSIDQDLLRYGALIFKGFFDGSDAQFKAAIKALGRDMVKDPLEKVPLRPAKVGGIKLAVNILPVYHLGMHHEFTSQSCPHRVLFYCNTPARSGVGNPDCG